MASSSINISFCSDFNEARKALDIVLSGLRTEIRYISDDNLFDLRVIYNELITNAIIHGNRSDKSKKVKLAVKIEDGLVFSSVEDEGEGFNFTEWFILKSYAEDLLSEHGRGLVLVNSLTDSIAFNDKGNKIDFYKFLSLPENVSGSKTETESYSIA